MPRMTEILQKMNELSDKTPTVRGRRYSRPLSLKIYSDGSGWVIAENASFPVAGSNTDKLLHMIMTEQNVYAPFNSIQQLWDLLTSGMPITWIIEDELADYCNQESGHKFPDTLEPRKDDFKS